MANLARLITASSLPAAGLILTTVKAAEKVHPSELDIYDKPSLNQEVFLEEPSSDLEKKISGGRKQIIGYWGNVKDVFGKGQSLAQSATVKTSEFMELISSDQTFQIKVAVISSGVLVGAIAAGRGRRPFRRLFYSAGLGSIAFSACYPQKAWVITKKGAEQSKVLFNKLKAMYDEQKQKRLTQAAEEKIETKATVEKPGEFVQEHPAPTLVKIQEPEPPTVVINEEIKDIGAMTITGALDSESERSYFSYIPFLGWFFKGSSSNMTTAESMVKEQTQTPLVGDKDEKCGCESSVPSANAKQEAVGDHGQSNPEDKDMYSTRE